MPDQRAASADGDPTRNTENRAMDGENDTATPDELRAEKNAIARDPELRDETPRSYEQEIDQGGETPSGKRTGSNEAWLEKLPGPNEH